MGGTRLGMAGAKVLAERSLTVAALIGLFPAFKKALDFVNRVSEAAEKQGSGIAQAAIEQGYSSR